MAGVMLRHFLNVSSAQQMWCQYFRLADYLWHLFFFLFSKNPIVCKHFDEFNICVKLEVSETFYINEYILFFFSSQLFIFEFYYRQENICLKMRLTSLERTSCRSPLNLRLHSSGYYLFLLFFSYFFYWTLKNDRLPKGCS